MTQITGKTGCTGLLGSPVAHSISPLMHNYSFQALDLHYVYLCFDVKERGLKAAVGRASRLKCSEVLISPCRIKTGFWNTWTIYPALPGSLCYKHGRKSKRTVL